MQSPLLHHVSLVTADLPRAITFYRDVLGLEQVERPNFPIAGAWFRSGGLEIHLIIRPDGSFRKVQKVDADDVHFAVRVTDFDATVASLLGKGYRADVAADDPRSIIVKKQSMAGYSQLYIRDPDNHVIEINAAYDT
jgi:glyoxylase I family protein